MPQSNQRGIETAPDGTDATGHAAPQSNQHGIETRSGPQQFLQRDGLNRTSVGLKQRQSGTT